VNGVDRIMQIESNHLVLKFQYKIKSLFLVLSLNIECLFFSTNALFGKQYEGSTSSNIYRVLLVSVLVINAVIYILSREWRLLVKELALLLLPILFAFSTLLTIQLYGPNELLSNQILYIIVYQYMGLLTAINMFSLYKAIGIDVICWAFEIFVIIVALAGLRSAVIPLISGQSFTSIGGNTYQSNSYYMALAGGINLWLLFNYLSKIHYKHTLITLNILFLAVQFVSMVFSGGRGAFILFIAITIYVFMIYFASNSSASKKLINFVMIVLFAMLALIILSEIEVFSTLSDSFNRIFSYISDKGIDISQTSGRDHVYQLSWEYVKGSLIIGHGISSYYSLMRTYPHNFFLEILFEGGLLYLLVWIIPLVILNKKRIACKRIEPRLSIMTVILLYPLVELMFSGSYMINTYFWFMIMWISIFQLPRNKRKI